MYLAVDEIFHNLQTRIKNLWEKRFTEETIHFTESLFHFLSKTILSIALGNKKWRILFI